MANGLGTNGIRLLDQNKGISKFSFTISNLGIIQEPTDSITASNDGRYILVSGVSFYPAKDVELIQDGWVKYVDGEIEELS